MNNNLNNNENNQNMNYQFQNVTPAPKKKSNTKLIIIILLAVLGVSLIPIIISTIIAIGPTNTYLNEARKGTFYDNSISAINSVRNDVIINGYKTNQCYNLDRINNIIDNNLDTSPFEGTYSNTSYIKAETLDGITFNYNICIVDSDGNGINYTSESNLNQDSITKNVKCTLPPECN